MLLDAGANVNARTNTNYWGSTALIRASENKHTEIVSMLLDNGADVNATDDDGDTALMRVINCDEEDDRPWYQVEYDIIEIVEMLLTAGADVNVVNNNNKTALAIAEETGCTKQIQNLIIKHIVAQSIPRHLERQEEQKQKWIDRKNLNATMAQFHVKKPYGHPRMHTDITRQIGDYLSKKPNDKLPAAGGKRRTRKSKKSNKRFRKTRSKKLRGGTWGESYLIRASDYFHKEMVSMYIENGADVNANYDDGNTALMIASYNGHIEVVILLLYKGADVNAKDNNDNTALIGASINGRTETVALLLNNGADVNAKDDDGMTALGAASEAGETEVVRLLLENGADVNVIDDNEYTALKWAVEFGHTSVVELLEKAIEVRSNKQKAMERIKEQNTQTDNIPPLSALVEKELTEEDRKKIHRASLEIDPKTGKLYYGGKRKTRRSKKSKRKTRKTRKNR